MPPTPRSMISQGMLAPLKLPTVGITAITIRSELMRSHIPQAAYAYPTDRLQSEGESGGPI